MHKSTCIMIRIFDGGRGGMGEDEIKYPFHSCCWESYHLLMYVIVSTNTWFAMCCRSFEVGFLRCPFSLGQGIKWVSDLNVQSCLNYINSTRYANFQFFLFCWCKLPTIRFLHVSGSLNSLLQICMESCVLLHVKNK